MKHLISFVLFVTVSAMCVAQPYGDSKFKQKFNKADALTYDGVYLEALPLLEDLYAFDTTNANLNYLLGVCYLLGKKDHDIAIKRLESATRDVSLEHQEANWKERKAPGLAYLYLGKAYHYKNRFDRAVTNYYNYRSFIEMDDVATYNKVRQQIQYAENAMELVKNPVGVKATNLGAGINTKYPDYCPVVSADGRVLIFTSRREGGTGGAKDQEGNYYDDIYVCQKQPNGKWSQPQSIGSNINTNGHEAAIGLSPDGQLLFIYKDDNGDGNIYQSRKTANGWTDPEELGSEINTSSWETHATVNATEDILVFVSNRSDGGYGGRDLWYCKKLPNNQWGLPMNMGSVINTQYEEDSPAISADGNTLIFSSQGHTSMGGFDIFKTEFVDGAWTVPENIGYPINTAEDDVFFSLTPDGRHAFYSSRMDGGFGDTDLYKLRLTPKQSNAVAVARGVLKVPAQDYANVKAQIVVSDEGGAQIGTYRPNPETGYYVLVLPPNETYSISYEADGYEPIVSQLPIDDEETYAVYDGVVELDEVVFGSDILAMQAERDRLEKEKEAAAARAAEEERLAAEALLAAEEEAKLLAVKAKEDEERRLAEQRAAKETEQAALALAEEEKKANQAEEERKKQEAKVRFEAQQAAAKQAEATAEKERVAKLAAEKQLAEDLAKEKAAQAELERVAQELAAEQEALKAQEEIAIAEEKKRVEAEAMAKAEEAAELERVAAAKREQEALKAQEEIAIAEEKKRVEAEATAKAEEAAELERVAAAKREQEELETKKAEAEELAKQEAALKTAEAEVASAEVKSTSESNAKQLELQARIEALRQRKQNVSSETKTKPAQEVKEVVASSEVADAKTQQADVDAAALNAKREAMLARIEQLKKRKSETEKTEEVSEPEPKENVVIAPVEKVVEEAEVDKVVENEVSAQSDEEVQEEVLAKANQEAIEAEIQAEAARKQLEELKKAEEQRIEQERLAAEKFEKEQAEEAERTRMELIQLEALAEQQSQVEAALVAEEKKKKAIQAAEADAFSEQEILANAATLEQLRDLNLKLIKDNLELKKQLVELNAKLDKILARLDYTPDASKVDLPASSTMRNLQEGKRLVLRNIFFDYNQATLRSRSKHELNKLYNFMKQNPSVSIQVSGHTDSRGNDDYNLRLSKDRAQAVVNYLIRNGISSNRLKSVGYGETRPIARNENSDLSDNPVGRQLNRRIEISIPKGAVSGVEVEPIQVPTGARIK